MENEGTFEDGIIDRERFCIGCGYNLRTLHWSSKCPECGRAVLDSLGKNLYSGDRKWLGSLRFGMILLSLHVVTALGAVLVAYSLSEPLLLVYLLTPVGSKMVILLAAGSRGLTAAALSIVAMMLYGAGIWCFTSTGSLESVKSGETNTWLRGGGMASCCIGLYALAFASLRAAVPGEWLVAIAGLLLEILQIGLTYARLANLAELAEARTLARVTRWLIVAHLLGLLVGLTCVAIVASYSVLIILLALPLAGLVLWFFHFQLLARAMRRN